MCALFTPARLLLTRCPKPLVNNPSLMQMAKSKRVLFTFDQRNYRNLEELTGFGRFSSASDAVKDALQLARTLQIQAQQGYTEVVVRNPDTREERVLVVPSLQTFSLEAEQ